MKIERVIIGNDHGGFVLKKKIRSYLVDKGLYVADAGSNHSRIVRYPYFAADVAKAVSTGEYERGILICSTGIGMSIIANKYKGVRASVVANSYLAKMTRAHNDSNVLCLGGKVIGVDLALDIVETWLTTEYIGGRHDISLGLIREAEQTQMSDNYWDANNAASNQL